MPDAEKRRGLTLGQIEEAQRTLQAGEVTAEEIEAMYPGYGQAVAELDKTMKAFSELARSQGIGKLGQAVMDSYRVNWKQLADLISKSSQIGDVLRMNEPVVLPPLHTAADATDSVRREVQELRAVMISMAATVESLAQVGQASLTQMVSVVALLGAGEKRDRTIVRLTWALVALTIVLAIPVLGDIWKWSEPVRSAILTWIQAR